MKPCNAFCSEDVRFAYNEMLGIFNDDPVSPFRQPERASGCVEAVRRVVADGKFRRRKR